MSTPRYQRARIIIDHPDHGLELWVRVGPPGVGAYRDNGEPIVAYIETNVLDRVYPMCIKADNVELLAEFCDQPRPVSIVKWRARADVPAQS